MMWIDTVEECFYTILWLLSFIIVAIFCMGYMLLLLIYYLFLFIIKQDYKYLYEKF